MRPIHHVTRVAFLASAGIDLALEYAVLGHGSPKTLVVSGVHGDERSGQLVIARLLRDLPSFHGTLTLLPVVNPLAFVLGVRTEPLTGQDLNRSFTGKNDGRPVFQLAATVMQLVKQHNYIIDLHNFTTAGLVQAGIAAEDDSAKMAELMNPDIVRIEHTSQEYRIHGALSAAARHEGSSYLLVELPTSERLTDEQAARVMRGIKRHLLVCTHYGSRAVSKLRNKPFVRIKLVKATHAGVFERKPSLKIGEIVKMGESLGTLTLLPSGSSIPVKSLYQGMLCELEYQPDAVVSPGETLCGIGELLPEHEKRSFFRDV